MPRYKYRAVNDKGRPIRGVVSSANESALTQKLEEGGLALIDCKELSEESGVLSHFSMRRVKIRELIQMFSHLEQMQRSGVPLLESLGDVRDTTDSAGLRDILSDVYREVAEGSSFSSALAQHPNTFDRIFISVINAGEETGRLPQAFLHVIRHLKWTDDMRRKVRKATRYPKILIVVTVGVVWMMMTYVVPQVTDFLKDIGKELPFVTVALIATSEFFGSYFLHCLAVAIAIYVFIVLGRNFSENFRYQTDGLILKLPVMGPVLRKIALSQFCSTFGTLFSSGMDMLRSLDAAKMTTGNLVIVEALTRVRENVQEGLPLSEALKLSGEFPSLVVRTVRIGEESGNLTEVLEQVSEFYDKDVDETVDAMITMIEPALTVILGIIIVWIAAAVFGPIYDSIATMGK